MLYMNAWGCAYPSVSYVDVPTWQLGPRDIIPTMPYIQADRGQFPYRVTAHWPEQLAHYCFNVCNGYPGIAGLFLDDFTPNVFWWGLSDRYRDVVWPGWRADGYATDYMDKAERFIRVFAGLRGKDVLVNGDARRHGPRIFEAFGRWTGPGDVAEHGRPGDYIVVKGLCSDGVSWGATVNEPARSGFPIGTSYLEVFRAAYNLAVEKDMGLALAYQTAPAGKSQYSEHGHWDPTTWEELVNG